MWFHAGFWLVFCLSRTLQVLHFFFSIYCYLRLIFQNQTAFSWYIPSHQEVQVGRHFLSYPGGTGSMDDEWTCTTCNNNNNKKIYKQNILFTFGPAFPVGPLGPLSPRGPWSKRNKGYNLGDICRPYYQIRESPLSVLRLSLHVHSSAKPAICTLAWVCWVRLTVGPLCPRGPGFPAVPCGHEEHTHIHSDQRSGMIKRLHPLQEGI